MRRLLTHLAIGFLASAGIVSAEDGPLFPVVKFGDDWMEGGAEMGFIDQAGNLVMPFTKEYLPINPTSSNDFFSGGLQPIQVGRSSHWPINKWGYLDRTFRLAIKPRFEFAEAFSEGLAAARINEPPWNFGYIDRQGTFVIPPQFEDAGPFSDDRAVVRVRGESLWGIIDRNGKWIVYPQYPALSQATTYSEGFACVSKKATDVLKPGESEFVWGYIDTSGKQRIDFKFKSASSFKDGIAVVRVDEGYGYIDHSGEFVIAPKFRMAWEFSEGLARVNTDAGEMAFIDRKGHFVFLVPEGRWADPFSNGLANVRVRGASGIDLWGYIDRTGKFVIPAEFQHAEPFQNNLARATRDGKTGYINKRGQFIWKTEVPSEIWSRIKQQN